MGQRPFLAYQERVVGLVSLIQEGEDKVALVEVDDVLGKGVSVEVNPLTSPPTHQMEFVHQADAVGFFDLVDDAKR